MQVRYLPAACLAGALVLPNAACEIEEPKPPAVVGAPTGTPHTATPPHAAGQAGSSGSSAESVTASQGGAAGSGPVEAGTNANGPSQGGARAPGLEPTPDDTDGDGWTDVEESVAGTDPLRPFVWDFDSSPWPNFSFVAAEAGVNGEAFAADEVLPDFTVSDQSGDSVNLYQFYGYVVMLVVSTGWCEHCRAEAPSLQALWERLRGRGLLVMQLLADDLVGSGFADLSFRQSWVQAFYLQFPVSGEGELPTLLSDLFDAGLFEATYPFFMVLDRQMRLTWTCVGVLECDYEARIAELLP